MCRKRRLHTVLYCQNLRLNWMEWYRRACYLCGPTSFRQEKQKFFGRCDMQETPQKYSPGQSSPGALGKVEFVTKD